MDNIWYNYKTDEFHPSDDNIIFLFVKTPIEDISGEYAAEGNNKKDANKRMSVMKMIIRQS